LITANVRKGIEGKNIIELIQITIEQNRRVMYRANMRDVVPPYGFWLES